MRQGASSLSGLRTPVVLLNDFFLVATKSFGKEHKTGLSAPDEFTQGSSERHNNVSTFFAPAELGGLVWITLNGTSVS